MHKVRQDLENQLANVDAMDDDACMFEDMATEPLENGDPKALNDSRPESPSTFLKRRSIPSEMSSTEALESPGPELVKPGSFDLPMDNSEKEELAQLLLQIQDMELRQVARIVAVPIGSSILDLCHTLFRQGEPPLNNAGPC